MVEPWKGHIWVQFKEIEELIIWNRCNFGHLQLYKYNNKYNRLEVKLVCYYILLKHVQVHEARDLIIK